MLIRGKVFRVMGEDVNTDEIISGRYKFDEVDMKKLAKHTFESIDPSFYEDSKQIENPILVASKNFGCGSSREQAPLVLKECVNCIIAESFARIFYRNSFNVGLPLAQCRNITSLIDEGDELEIDLDGGKIKNSSRREEYEFRSVPKFMRDLLDAGGLIEKMKKDF